MCPQVLSGHQKRLSSDKRKLFGQQVSMLRISILLGPSLEKFRYGLQRPVAIHETLLLGRAFVSALTGRQRTCRDLIRLLNIWPKVRKGHGECPLRQRWQVIKTSKELYTALTHMKTVIKVGVGSHWSFCYADVNAKMPSYA